MAHLKWNFPLLLGFFFLVSLLLPSTLALSTTLPDGRMIRIPALKPLPESNNSTLPVTHIHLANGRLPKTKPKPPLNATVSPEDTHARIMGTMCGLDPPSQETWDYYRTEFGEWIRPQFDDYKLDDRYQSFALFLRDLWAPNTVSSNLYCDAIGACSISTCKSLVDDDGTNRHDRQMALLAFEQLANAAHLFKAVEDEFVFAFERLIRNSDTIIEEFSSGPRIENALKDELKKEQLAMQIAQAIGLITSGAFSFVGGAVTGSVTMVVNTYIGIAGIVRELQEEPTIVHDLKKAFLSDLNLVLDKTRDSIRMDFHDLMIGGEDHLGRTIIDVMATSGFLEPKPDFMPRLGQHIGRTALGAAINKMWEFDRAYFVMPENPGGCENERTTYVRGPHDVLICLPEHNGLGFWFFSIDRALENDAFRVDQAQVRGPTGYWRLNGADKYFGLNLRDVARSSFHQYKIDTGKIKDESHHYDPLTIDHLIRDAKEEVRMLGVFKVPICNNPGGEAISGILDTDGQNYPCICGGNPWNGVDYSVKKDESVYFLTTTRFSQSEDYEDYCRGHNHCKENEDINIRPQLEAARKPGDLSIAKKIHHPYKQCKKRRDSLKHKGWPQRDRENRTKRNLIDWAVHDELGRNTSRAVVPFGS